MKNGIGKWIVVGCALSLPAFAQGQMQQREQKRQPQQMQMQQRAGIPLPQDTQGFLSRVHMVNEHEIEVARLAEQNAQNPQVKQYAQRLIQEHQKLDQQLTQLARAQNIELAEPEPVNDLERKMMQAMETEVEILRGLKGEAFDREFANAMVGDHDYAIVLTSAAVQQVENPKLRQSLQQSLPILEQHRQTAYQLLGQLRARPQPAVGGAGEQGMEQMEQMEHGMEMERMHEEMMREEEMPQRN